MSRSASCGSVLHLIREGRLCHLTSSPWGLGTDPEWRPSAPAGVSRAGNVPRAGWEEGGGRRDEAGAPLLDKADHAALQRQSTVAMLLSFSAQDTPLLLVAFVAGAPTDPRPLGHLMRPACYAS